MEKLITLSGKIDSSNAHEEELRITNELDGFKGKIIIDVKDLKYISSAGLRVILKIKKLYKDTKIINCNSEVYEIFEMTGFTQMMYIKKAIKSISIDGCEIKHLYWEYLLQYLMILLELVIYMVLYLKC